MGQYYYIPDPGEPNSGFAPPVPDQLAQLRQRYTQRPITQPPHSPQPPQQQDSSGIIWVQGEAGAKAYMVAPGNTVQLWDSENQVIYLKSADMSGMPSMRVLDYTERNAARPAVQQQQQVPQIDMSNVVMWDKLDAYLDAYFAERQKRPTKATKQKEDAENG